MLRRIAIVRRLRTHANAFGVLFVCLASVPAELCLGQGTVGLSAAPFGTAAEALQKMRSLTPKEDADPKTAAEQMQGQLAVLTQMEKQFPKAKELHQARVNGVMIAVRLAQLTNNPQVAYKAKEIGRALIASDAPIEMKLSADAHIVLLEVRPVGSTSTRPAGEKGRLIVEFAKRYARTDVALNALIASVQLAELGGLDDLAEGFQNAIMTNFPSSRMAQMLKQRWRWRNKPFKATLTKLDGKKLTLPDDLLGQVVVIDFWATWCGPCVAELPNMKKLYAQYKPKGVEFVGISLDRGKRVLEKFVEDRKIGWIQTYADQRGYDPTAKAYEISAIPSMWVIGKDGKVVSADARGRLAEVIEKALRDSERSEPSKTPTTGPGQSSSTRPSTAPATAPAQ